MPPRVLLLSGEGQRAELHEHEGGCAALLQRAIAFRSNAAADAERHEGGTQEGDIIS